MTRRTGGKGSETPKRQRNKGWLRHPQGRSTQVAWGCMCNPQKPSKLHCNPSKFRVIPIIIHYSISILYFLLLFFFFFFSFFFSFFFLFPPSPKTEIFSCIYNCLDDPNAQCPLPNPVCLVCLFILQEWSFQPQATAGVGVPVAVDALTPCCHPLSKSSWSLSHACTWVDL